jgi:hypothetical protein
MRLRSGHAYSSDGYSGSTRADLSVVLRRTKVKRRVQVYHVPAEFARVLARRVPAGG